ncbi:PAS-domain containing protein [Roseicyclus elongatus]|uniref:PAS-domain containing protein n=1 Tax=Roseicyclus elongatus TaxID=159346 RepID=UPI0004B2BC9D|nr:PAS-domain containing protein [Roseibacterium elongatum]
MIFPDGVAYLAFAAISLLTAVLALIMTAKLAPGRAAPDALRPAALRPQLDLLHRYEFREGYLLSPVAEGDAFLPENADRTGAYDMLGEVLGGLHPDVPGCMRALRKRGEAFALTGQMGDDRLSVSGRQEEGRLVLSVGPAEPGDGRAVVDGQTFAKLQEEVGDMRAILDATAIPTWKQDDERRIVWANAAYLALAERFLAGEHGRASLGWPLPQVFGDQVTPLPAQGTVRRCSLAAADPDAAAWFEVSAEPQPGGAAICMARPIDRLVAAETSLRSFVQTLSKTFASLPTGLAVFDKRRNLVMFNPALVTQSTLGIDFLSARPSLVEFLDHLRERRRMPEPRDYRSWRDQIARLEEGAADGTYQELWTLPDGDSLRVTGRPHPDGAVALLFEDISQEVTLTRQFRADLDLYRSVLEDDAAALAVFGRDGQMMLSNAAYAKLVGG